ncbi:hypothetical protein FS749_011777 [Ceratobasidium sp. UAMH 11750]|nr:hypothetical protein FS749_011777 [Ceratobasidium sp. UAMH 11750]
MAANSLAKIIYDARCEVQSTSISEPIDIHLSQGNACLAVIGMGGYKQRVPHLEYYLLEGSEASSDFPTPHFLKPGLADVAVHATTDESRRLIFVADKHRVKSFAWAAPNGEIYEEPHPTHTLASGQARGPLAVFPNGTIVKAGVGKVAVWNIDSLGTHGTNGRKIIGSKDRNTRENTWRDDPEDIEMSSGNLPSSSIQFSGHADLAVGRWKPLVQAPSTMLSQIGRCGCATIDLEHEGSVVARYLGHSGTVTDLSVSAGDPQTFLTACSDGFARLFDTRTPLPVLTFDACQNTDSCDSAVLAHPDGIPTVFSGTDKAEQIKMWDVRAHTPVYELATGNNRVQSLAWDPTRNHLYAATECRYYDWMGYHHEYRYARRGVREAPVRDEDDEDGWVDDDDEDDDEYTDHGEGGWPDNAWHLETHFEYMFDAGDHRVYRYAFKEDPNVSILPEYGDGRPGEMDSFW